MEPNALTLTNLRLSTTCSTKFPRDQNQTNTPKSYAQIPKRSPGPVSKGLQKDSKKDLSRILRTDAAIKGIARKANSRKYTQLWPKAVLEALDEAIRENQWQTALKVCGFCFSFQIVVFDLFFFFLFLLGIWFGVILMILQNEGQSHSLSPQFVNFL